MAELNDGLFLVAPKPLDKRLGRFVSGVWRPFISVNEALTYIPDGMRYDGMFVPVRLTGSNVFTHYYFNGGTTDDHFFLYTNVVDVAAIGDLRYSRLGHTHDAGDIVSGVLNDARLSSHVTLQGNVFNGANDLLQLGTDGKILLSNIPDALLRGDHYKGTYNGTVIVSDDPDYNGHALPASTHDTTGIYFIVTSSFTLGGVTYAIRDWIISNGDSGWSKVTNSDAVTTVFGRTGNILAVDGDYDADQITFAPYGGLTDTNVQDALSTVYDLANNYKGTVTSVSLSLPVALFTVSGSPIIASGTLGATLATQNANLVFAGPSSGSAATPTFRALAGADIPFTSGYSVYDARYVKSSDLTVDVRLAVSATGTLIAYDNTTGIFSTNYVAENVANKGAASGYVPLNGSTKIDLTYLPDSILGAVVFVALWNANTNTPTLPDPTTVKGHYYICNVAGTYSSIDYKQGDWVISDGITWDKVDNSDAITSFNGRLGNIVLNSTDVTDALGYVPQPLDADLTAISALSGTGYAKRTGVNTWTLDTTGFVPYNGATAAVNLGNFDLTVYGMTIGRGRLSVASNSAFGVAALGNITTGANNTGVGLNALAGIQAGSGNTAVGTNALSNGSTTNNTAIGYFALQGTTSGSNNVAVGVAAGFANIAGSYNVFVGVNAGVSGNGGDNNISIGFNAGGANIGSNNVTIGYNAATSLTNFSNNTVIGYQATITSNSVTNSVALGNGANATASNQIRLGNGSITSVITSGSITATLANTVTANIIYYDTVTGLFTFGTSSAYVPYTGAIADVNIGTHGYLGGYLTLGTGDVTNMPTPSLALASFNTNSSSGAKIAAIFRGNQTAATTGSIQGLEGYVKLSHTSGSVVAAIGTIGNIEVNGAGGTTVWARSVQAGGVITAGSVTNWARYYASAGTGSPTNNYSYYAESGSGIGYINDGLTLAGALNGTTGIFSGQIVANSPAGGVTGEGLVVGLNMKLDASGTGQSAKVYVVNDTLSDTYGSGFQFQVTNTASTYGFGLNLGTTGAFELYEFYSAGWHKRFAVTAAGALYAPALAMASASYTLFFDPATGLITYNTAGGGGSYINNQISSAQTSSNAWLSDQLIVGTSPSGGNTGEHLIVQDSAKIAGKLTAVNANATLNTGTQAVFGSFSHTATGTETAQYENSAVGGDIVYNISSTFTPNTTSKHAAITANVFKSGAGAYAGVMSGVFSAAEFSDAGNVSTYAAFRAFSPRQYGPGTAYTGTITEAIGVLIDDLTTGTNIGSKITTMYAFKQLGASDKVLFASNNIYMTALPSSSKSSVVMFDTVTGKLSYGPTPTGTFSGLGASNFIAKFSGSSSLTSSVMSEASSSIGINETSPGLRLTVKGTDGVPASSGTTALGSLRLETATSNSTLDFGCDGASSLTHWIQASDKTSHGTHYTLALNPNGGKVSVGKFAPSYTFEVNGDIAITASSGGVYYYSDGTSASTAAVPYSGATGNVNIGGSYSFIGYKTISNQVTANTYMAGFDATSPTDNGSVNWTDIVSGASWWAYMGADDRLWFSCFDGTDWIQKIYFDITGNIKTEGIVYAADGLKTGIPAGGAGANGVWKLGQIQGYSGILDTANIIEAQIDGIFCRIALMT